MLALRVCRGAMGDSARCPHMQDVQYGNIADRWHGVPGHPQAAAHMVPCNMVHHQPEEWCLFLKRMPLIPSGGCCCLIEAIPIMTCLNMCIASIMAIGCCAVRPPVRSLPSRPSFTPGIAQATLTLTGSTTEPISLRAIRLVSP